MPTHVSARFSQVKKFRISAVSAAAAAAAAESRREHPSLTNASTSLQARTIISDHIDDEHIDDMSMAGDTGSQVQRYLICFAGRTDYRRQRQQKKSIKY